MTTAVKVTVIEPPGGLKVHCPTCEGKKEVFAFMNTGEDYTKHRQGMIPCITCGGTGAITVEHARRIIEGRVKYDDRIARGETLKDAATRMGLTPAQLSAIEHGREPSNVGVQGRPRDAD